MGHQFDPQKFKAVVHSVIARCPNASAQLGTVKLHKVLYFADMLRYLQTGTPLTGAVYRRQPLGPMADALGSTLRALVAQKLIDVSEGEYFGYRKRNFRSLQEPDPTALTSDELRLLEDVIDFVCVRNSAASISEISHTPAWSSVAPGDVMPYRTAHLIFAGLLADIDGDEDPLEWALAEEKRVEEGAGRYLDDSAVRTLRARLGSASRA